MNSAACVQAMRDARIALNVMPWFKDGAHDRVFTAMLQGTVALTDDSRYLREECRDGENICFYSLRALEQLPDQVVSLLEDPVRMAELAERGRMWMLRSVMVSSDWMSSLFSSSSSSRL